MLDLTKFVTSPDGQAVSYSVVSGGGSVSGSNYTQVFDTVGTKTIKLRAADVDDATEFTFTVQVQTGQEAVLKSGTGLVLLDRGA